MNLSRLLIPIAAACVLSTAPRLAAEGTASGGGYTLKHRSAFRIDRDSRVPFWPIGYKKPTAVAGGNGEAAEIEAKKPQIQPGQFRVTSILMGNPALATINGRSFEEGELLPVVNGGERLRVSVRAIRDGGIWLDHDGQVIFVPLARTELGPKKADKPVRQEEFTIDISAPVTAPPRK
jgi:hypothetical protein